MAAALALGALALCSLLAAFSGASFTDTTQNPQTAGAVADFLGPSAEASTIAKSQGGIAGYIRAGGTYYVYARVADSGNPASGIASVKTNVSAITSGQTAAVLTAGSYTAGGASYNYRSAQLTASGSLSAGSKAYTLALVDSAGNARTQSFSVTVDNGPFAGSSFTTTNASGGTAGKPEEGDTVAFAFNKAPDPGSIVSGWSGSGTKSVVVSIADNAADATLTVAGATLGSVELEGNYAANKKTAVFSASNMSMSGSIVTIVLGSESANAKKDTNKNPSVWTPSSAVFDVAGNSCSVTKVNGANVRQF